MVGRCFVFALRSWCGCAVFLLFVVVAVRSSVVWGGVVRSLGSVEVVRCFGLVCLVWSVSLGAGLSAPFLLFWGFVVLPASVSGLLSSASAVGFSGARSPGELVPRGVVVAAVSAVPAGVPVSVGCQRGVDEFVRSCCPGAVVFRASSFGSGRGAFVARSVACVRSVAVPSGVWVSFPASVCPAGLLPSSSSSRCFCGAGSGSWASLAFALGLGVACGVWLPSSVPCPAGWGLVPAGEGWFVSGPAPVQLSLF